MQQDTLVANDTFELQPSSVEDYVTQITLEQCISNPLVREVSNLSEQSQQGGAHFVPFDPRNEPLASKTIDFTASGPKPQMPESPPLQYSQIRTSPANTSYNPDNAEYKETRTTYPSHYGYHGNSGHLFAPGSQMGLAYGMANHLLPGNQPFPGGNPHIMPQKYQPMHAVEICSQYDYNQHQLQLPDLVGSHQKLRHRALCQNPLGMMGSLMGSMGGGAYAGHMGMDMVNPMMRTMNPMMGMTHYPMMGGMGGMGMAMMNPSMMHMSAYPTPYAHQTGTVYHPMTINNTSPIPPPQVQFSGHANLMVKSDRFKRPEPQLRTSIFSLLPMDIIQKCLSFDQSDETDLVCKAFKMCNDKNKSIRERERLVAVKEAKFEPNVPKYDASTNTTWVVRKEGPLSGEESQKGYVLMREISHALDECRDGDIILIDGQHDYGSLELYLRGKVLQIIGTGKNAKLRLNVRRLKNCALFFKNLEIESTDAGFFDIRSSSSVWMENCTLKARIYLGERCNLHLKSCDLITRWPSLLIYHPSVNLSVGIIGCKFIEHGLSTSSNSSCIHVRGIDDLAIYEKQKSFSMECIGNSFKGNADSIVKCFLKNGTPNKWIPDALVHQIIVLQQVHQIIVLQQVHQIIVLKQNLLNGQNADGLELV